MPRNFCNIAGTCAHEIFRISANRPFGNCIPANRIRIKNSVKNYSIAELRPIGSDIEFHPIGPDTEFYPIPCKRYCVFFFTYPYTLQEVLCVFFFTYIIPCKRYYVFFFTYPHTLQEIMWVLLHFSLYLARDTLCSSSLILIPCKRYCVFFFT